MTSVRATSLYFLINLFQVFEKLKYLNNYVLEIVHKYSSDCCVADGHSADQETLRIL